MSAAAGLSPESFGFLRQHVYDGSGIVVRSEQQYLVEARLGPVARESGLESLNHLCETLRATPGSPLHSRVVEAMTTNETYFFREPVQYEALKNSILPDLIRNREATRKLSFWSAASSTGQEAYSLTMMLLEMGLREWNLDILATDLCLRVLDRAASGRFSQLEVNRGLAVTYLLKYFRRAGVEWELNPEVRGRVRFQPFDLRASMRSKGPFDIVFCRNVLIYFDMPTRQAILKEIHATLFKGGFLVLGTAEGGLPIGECYERQNLGSSVIYVAR
jgi:chemotaxis protein methyltransferase CheR